VSFLQVAVYFANATFCGSEKAEIQLSYFFYGQLAIILDRVACLIDISIKNQFPQIRKKQKEAVFARQPLFNLSVTINYSFTTLREMVVLSVTILTK